MTRHSLRFFGQVPRLVRGRFFPLRSASVPSEERNMHRTEWISQDHLTASWERIRVRERDYPPDALGHHMAVNEMNCTGEHSFW